ncbi:spidroin-2-like [Bos mutus]|uniref:spidroin-2-like n=1 Tax=Bos mutus TaxID=72004 RepID=UPI0038B5186B
MRVVRSNDLPEKRQRVTVLLGIGELVHAASVCKAVGARAGRRRGGAGARPPAPNVPRAGPSSRGWGQAGGAPVGTGGGGCQFPAVEMPAKSEGAGEEAGGLDPGGGPDAGSWAATPASRPPAAPTQRGGARRAPTPAAALGADSRGAPPTRGCGAGGRAGGSGLGADIPPGAGEGADPTHVQAGEVGGRTREAGARPTGRRGSGPDGRRESGGATDAGTYRAAPSCCPALPPPLGPAGEQRDPPRSQPLRPSMPGAAAAAAPLSAAPPITPPSATQHPAHSPAPAASRSPPHPSLHPSRSAPPRPTSGLQALLLGGRAAPGEGADR